MRSEGEFHYYMNESECLAADSLVCDMPTVASMLQLMKALSAGLCFPTYFGSNWDALDECMRDFSWIKQHEIRLLHSALPDLPKDELHMYLDILLGAVQFWSEQPEHQLFVFFPEVEKDEIELWRHERSD